MDDVLDVDETAHAEADGDAFGVGDELLDDGLGQVDGGVDGETVAGVDAGPLDVLHDAGDEGDFAVADCVDFDFLALQVLVDEDGRLLGGCDDVGEVALEIGFLADDLHGAATEDVAGAHEDGVPDVVGDGDGVADGSDPGAWWLRNAEAVEEPLEPAAVLGEVDGVDG